MNFLNGRRRIKYEGLTILFEFDQILEDVIPNRNLPDLVAQGDLALDKFFIQVGSSINLAGRRYLGMARYDSEHRHDADKNGEFVFHTFNTLSELIGYKTKCSGLSDSDFLCSGLGGC